MQIESVRRHANRQEALLARLRDPRIEALQRRDRFVAALVEGLRSRFGDAAHGEIRRRHRALDRGGGRRRPTRRPRGRCSAFGIEEGDRVSRALADPPDRLAARQEARVRVDERSVRLVEIGDAARQGVELHRLQERDEGARIKLRQGEIVEGNRERRLAVERHETLRESRLVGMLDEAFPTLRLLDLACAGKERFEIAELLDELRGGLEADPRDAGDVVGGVAHQRQHVADPAGRNALPTLGDGGLVEVALGPVARLALDAGFEVVEAYERPDELHQVLVGGDDQDVRAARLRLLGIGGDEIVRLVALPLDGFEPEGADRFAHQG